MKRNWDIIRKILIKVEAAPTEFAEIESDSIEGVDSETAAYHMRLMIESGLVLGSCRSSIGTPWCHLRRLTWEGHELLDQIKRETIWNKVKEQSMQRGVELSMEVIKQVASQIIRQVLGS
jgi:Hypothetical protein (DUF2513)